MHAVRTSAHAWMPCPVLDLWTPDGTLLDPALNNTLVRAAELAKRSFILGDVNQESTNLYIYYLDDSSPYSPRYPHGFPAPMRLLVDVRSLVIDPWSRQQLLVLSLMSYCLQSGRALNTCSCDDRSVSRPVEVGTMGELKLGASCTGDPEQDKVGSVSTSTCVNCSYLLHTSQTLLFISNLT